MKKLSLVLVSIEAFFSKGLKGVEAVIPEIENLHSTAGPLIKTMHDAAVKAYTAAKAETNPNPETIKELQVLIADLAEFITV